MTLHVVKFLHLGHANTAQAKANTTCTTVLQYNTIGLHVYFIYGTHRPTHACLQITNA